MQQFKLHTEYEPAGDQGEAIAALHRGIQSGHRFQTLKGVTGSGKTFTMAKIIEQLNVPALVLSHNKTLAAQLYREFKDFFPENAVEYFVSYYDYYQPEAYVPGKDLYIAKDASINQEIDRMRLAASTSLMERRDVIVVATVSCIYGVGNPDDYRKMTVKIKAGEKLGMHSLLQSLVTMQYNRKDAILERGTFRLKGDVLELYPSYAEEAFRIECNFDMVERITRINPLTGDVLRELDMCTIFPAKYFVMPKERVDRGVEAISAELKMYYAKLLADGKQLEAERIKSRTEYDLEMLREMGYCTGIENYSRPLSGRAEGERPAVLIDFFPEHYLMFVDESHVTLPQVRGMYEGDRSRKTSLVDYGFRLPSALDNRPLYYSEFESLQDQVIYVSATPGQEELGKSQQVVEQVIRPTGLLDPEIDVRTSTGQIENLYGEITQRVAAGERTLVTTLTKKMAEDLSAYLANLGLKVSYLHAEVETIERVEILKNLRLGVFDVLVGVNLLREGLDLPEVSLIAILDADKIGFLRSATSLIQIIGRAARNVNGKVLMYADKMSTAMEEAIRETNRRRTIQQAYNEAHGITPTTIRKAIRDILHRKQEEIKAGETFDIEIIKKKYNILVPKERKELLRALDKEMLELAKNLEFERAAVVRDEIRKLQSMIG